MSDPTPPASAFAAAASLLQHLLPAGGDLCEPTRELIGPYRLIETLGSGGFGVVWRARQTLPVEREVALKMIKPGMSSEEVLARFEQERQVLATMEHPHIAAMLDAGVVPDGRPYFVMELIKGEPVTTCCASREMMVSERLALFIEVCLAVQHAHQKGVIHRDLKPSNVLVADVDGRLVPKIIDFGIAKALAPSRDAAQALKTRAGISIGTPVYMAPELFAERGSPDTRSDVYALGAVLYEVLTGQPPFDPEELSGVGEGEMRRIIREVTPVKPSARGHSGKASAHGAASRSSDLDWITMRALEKEPSRRYASAAELAADLQRFLDHEPVLAHPPSLGYVAARWVRRHRVMFAAAVFCTLVLLSAGSVALWHVAVARHERQVALAEARRAINAEVRAKGESTRAEQTAKFLTDLLDGAADEIAKGHNPEVLRLTLSRSTTLLTLLDDNPTLQVSLLDRVGDLYASVGDWPNALAQMRARVQLLARLHGKDSAKAVVAELEQLAREADHGARTSVPPQLVALKARVERHDGRGSELWFDVQRQLVRVLIKVKNPAQALAVSQECLAEAGRQKSRGKLLIDIRLSHVAALEAAGRFEEAETLLAECRDMALRSHNESRLRQCDDRQIFIYKSKGTFEEAITALRKQLDALRLERGDHHRDLVPVLDRLAGFEFRTGQHDIAFQHGRQALDLARELASQPGGDSYRETIGTLLRHFSLAESSLGHHEQAMNYALEARLNAEAQGNLNSIYLAMLSHAGAHYFAGRNEEVYRLYEECQRFRQSGHLSFKNRIDILHVGCLKHLKEGRIEEGLALGRKLWADVRKDPEGIKDAPLQNTLANTCVNAWALIKTLHPATPLPPEMPEWQSALIAGLHLNTSANATPRP